jgi:hypothetical protein
VRSLRSASRSGKERGTSIEARTSIEAVEREKVRTLFGRVECLDVILRCNFIAV